jgi:LPXTG-motif cell wall-anchored protein
MKKKPSLKTILYSLIVLFVLILSFIFLFPDTGDLKNKLFLFVGLLALLFLVLGVVVIYIAKKKEGKLKIYLMLTGASAIAPLVATILHNLFMV